MPDLLLTKHRSEACNCFLTTTKAKLFEDGFDKPEIWVLDQPSPPKGEACASSGRRMKNLPVFF